MGRIEMKPPDRGYCSCGSCAAAIVPLLLRNCVAANSCAAPIAGLSWFLASRRQAVGVAAARSQEGSGLLRHRRAFMDKVAFFD